jgi:hypothetical protein
MLKEGGPWARLFFWGTIKRYLTKNNSTYWLAVLGIYLEVIEEEFYG